MKKIEKKRKKMRKNAKNRTKSDIGHLGGVGPPSRRQKTALRHSASIAFYRLPRPNDRILRGAPGGVDF